MKDELTVEHSRGMLKKYREMKKGVAETLNIMGKYCDYFEKYRNLVMWGDPRMTRFISVVVVILLVIVTYIPIRIFLYIALTLAFYSG